MSKIYEDNGTVIKITFPKKKFESYLKKFRASSVKKLTFTQTEKIFLLAAADFKKGKLFLEEFSEICGHLWHFALRNHKEKIHTDLGDALYAGGELSYHIRHTQDKLGGRGFVKFMNTVMRFVSKKMKS